ncbi:glycosyltransferase family 4 protein [Loktanella sp. IMCC34160]|uniref:glycosyltransferase family 4 protein n=1 Tax=Loktanella sp. IMCC34160 TaxID=2510646 RepID=UPI001F5CF7A5|nr:glycosyltransferase family 4 protein [Loktanella sp. IMCC34160]
MVFTSASPRTRTGWTRFLVSKCDEVIATNQVNADVMMRGCVIIPHGVDIECFFPSNEAASADEHLVIGCYGRIRPLKGTQDFVEAVCRLLPDHPNWSAVVMGRVLPRDRSFFDGLVERVEKAGLAGRIGFKPEVSLEDMPAAYRELAIYVAPSHLEGFGLTVAEALASGVPTIATRGVGAFDTLVDTPKNGLLYQPGDVVDLEAKLLQLMEDDELRGEMGHAARASAIERMSLEVEADQLVEVYRRLLTA